MKLGKIEKWMKNNLGVRRMPNPRGSLVRYEHRAIEEIKGDGTFGIHIAHGKNREIIYKKNFTIYLYPRLREIIQYMKKEGLCDSEES